MGVPTAQQHARHAARVALCWHLCGWSKPHEHTLLCGGVHVVGCCRGAHTIRHIACGAIRFAGCAVPTRDDDGAAPVGARLQLQGCMRATDGAVAVDSDVYATARTRAADDKRATCEKVVDVWRRCGRGACAAAARAIAGGAIAGPLASACADYGSQYPHI